MSESEDFLEEEPRQGRSRSGRWKAMVSAIIALALVGAGYGVYSLVFSNSGPVASFTGTAIDLRLQVNAEKSSSPSGGIKSYAWTWGDGSSGTGVRTSHNYSDEGTYAVTLTVKDDRGADGTSSQSFLMRVLPTAFFIPRQDRMTTLFNASDSYSTIGGNITSYSWDFGDGTTGSGMVTNHTYQAQGRYVVRLEVTDAKGRVGNTTRFVSPADTTVDILADRFFSAECPYSPYWAPRQVGYGDVILNDQVPCVDYYPWVITQGSKDPSWIYTVYHFNARVRNHPGYNLQDPVVLPIVNASVAPLAVSYIHYDLTFDYATPDYINSLNGTIWQIGKQYDDGYGVLYRGNITMDLTMAKRVFGVPVDATPAQAQQWWSQNTVRGRTEGPAEAALDGWMVRTGSVNGKYDIESGYEWNTQADFIDLNATVAPDGTTRIQIFFSGWGLEALFQRWWYWGAANYYDAVNQPLGQVKPLGWMPMEVCWCEKSTIDFTIRGSLDLDYDTVQTYHFQAWSNWGPDGIPGTEDDLPAWIWAPYDMDYVPRASSGLPGEEGYPNSELAWWEGKNVIWGTPGSYAYGQPFEIMNAPARWTLNPGSTLTIVLPRFSVPWYDPVNSKWTYSPSHKYGNYSTFNAPMTLRQVCTNVDDPSTCSTTGDYFLWDARGKVISIAGPHAWTGGTYLQPAPWLEFGPES